MSLADAAGYDEVNITSNRGIPMNTTASMFRPNQPHRASGRFDRKEPWANAQRLILLMQSLALVGMLTIAAVPEVRAEEPPAAKTLPNPLFAVCVSTHDARYRTPQQQATLLKELGFDGFSHVWIKGAPQAIGASEKVGLHCYGIKSDPRKHLTRSMAAWRKMSAEIAD
jgi:hypothetical protein